MDKNFKKGYVAVHPETEVSLEVDAHELAQNDLIGLAKDFNLIYTELAVKEGFLDRYLLAKGLEIDYSDYGPPHNGKRPSP